MVVHLCGEIDRGHTYLLELAPSRQNHTELVHSLSIILYCHCYIRLLTCQRQDHTELIDSLSIMLYCHSNIRLLTRHRQDYAELVDSLFILLYCHCYICLLTSPRQKNELIHSISIFCCQTFIVATNLHVNRTLEITSNALINLVQHVKLCMYPRLNNAELVCFSVPGLITSSGQPRTHKFDLKPYGSVVIKGNLPSHLPSQGSQV